MVSLDCTLPLSLCDILSVYPHIVFLILVEVSLSLQLFKQKNLEVIPKCALYLSLVTSALPMSFIDCISNILTPFFCDHFHFYLYGPINYNFHLTYFISVDYFLTLLCSTNIFTYFCCQSQRFLMTLQ